jgi:hypothetical protein
MNLQLHKKHTRTELGLGTNGQPTSAGLDYLIYSLTTNLSCPAKIKLLGTFAMDMQEACFSRSSHDRLAHGFFASAISHVCHTIHKHSRPNPSMDDDGKPGFLLQWELRAFKKEDPAEKHQKAIPMLVISAFAKQQISKLDQTIVQ